MAERFEYAVLEVCGRIHGACCGTGDGLADDEARELFTWFFWRLHDGWREEHNRWSPYEDAVRMLGLAALEELNIELSRRAREARSLATPAARENGGERG